MIIKKISRNTLIIICLSLFLFGAFSCTKDENNNQTSNEIKIISLTASDTIIKAWVDTTHIQVTATGDSLVYAWEANHGAISGKGSAVKYAAGQCCVGLNTISCTVSNRSGKVSSSIKIRVKSYFEK